MTDFHVWRTAMPYTDVYTNVGLVLLINNISCDINTLYVHSDILNTI